MLRTHLILALFLPLAMLGCSDNDQPTATAGGSQTVVATTPLLADITRTLLDGVQADVATLIPADQDARTFSEEGIDTKLVDARLVVFNGLNFEAGLSQSLASLSNGVAVADFVPADQRIATDAFGGDYDPHVYMDVGLFAEHGVVGLAGRLKEAFPADAARIDENLQGLLGNLARLDSYAEAAMTRVPEAQRVLVTDDPGFAYFANAYGLAVQTGGEAIDEPIFARAPDLQDKFESTYLGMMDHNVTVIASELGAPGIDVHGAFGRLTLGHDHDH